jgi:hypothetical protein
VVTTRYPTPQFRRLALAPAILTAIVLVAGIALIGLDGYIIIRFVVSILTLIVAVFAWQARQWWWIPLLAAIAVLFNPVVPIEVGGGLQLAGHYLSALVVVVVGLFVKVRNPEDRNPRLANKT